MPTTTDNPRVIRDSLRAAISAKDLSVRGVAKLIAERTGAPLEQERRRVHRYLAEPPMMATEPTRRLIEECIGLETGELDGDDEEDESDDLYEVLFASLRSVIREEIAAAAARHSRVVTA